MEVGRQLGKHLDVPAQVDWTFFTSFRPLVDFRTGLSSARGGEDISRWASSRETRIRIKKKNSHLRVLFIHLLEELSEEIFLYIL